MKGLAGALYAARERRRAEQARSSYSALLASPASLGSAAVGASLTGFQVLASAEYSISLNAATDAGEVTVTVGGDTLGIAGGASGARFSLGFLEKGETVVVNRLTGAPAGTLTLSVLDNWRRSLPVATGVFS